MTCDDFRRGYRNMSGTSVDVEGQRRRDWNDHHRECHLCGAWYRAQQVRDRGADPRAFPCEHIAYHVTHACSQHDDPWACPDHVLVYDDRFDEYGIPIRDGGRSQIVIAFCPWCGLDLPQSRRERWFETLASLGYDEPWSQDIPADFKSDRWWRRLEESKDSPGK